MTVTVEGLKAHLNLDHDEDDALLATMIGEAVAWIEGYTGTPVPVENTPAALDGATRQLAAHWYENRGEDAGASIPDAVKSLIMPFRDWSF